MKRLLSFILFAPILFGGIVPNRYIVELSTEPAAAQAARLRARDESPRAALRRAGVEQARVRIRDEQRRVRAAVEERSGRVRAQVETASNALIVEIPDAQAAQLTQIAGVRKVYPVRTFHLLLDHALPLHHVPEAWSQVGFGNAGAGVKVAIIDTGVDTKHAAFQDASLAAPTGFPRASSDSDLAYTNSKVIVARSYANLFESNDPDPSPADHVGHGTATAMCAAGVRNTGPLATITGVAPRAWIGNYKVFGTPGVNDGTSDDILLAAIDDAVADGMDVISMSLGSDIATRLEDDPEVLALEHAASLGIIVVAAAGNNGPNPGTVGSPANGPSVIAVGAGNNDRLFAATARVGGAQPYIAVPGSGANSRTPITAPLVDVASLDPTGLLCSSAPAGSLNGSVAFILRGVCTFEEKLNFAQTAGAVAALVYTDQARPEPISMGVGAATLPAEMVSYQDGIAIKALLRNPQQATLQFTLGPAYVDPARLGDFSARGPNVDFTVKPDLVAVGTNVYMATQKLDSRGEMYSADGYTTQEGTSFSAPIVAGAAALLKAARPGLSAAQYRSLLANTAAPAYLAPGTSALVQQAGAGSLDLSAALNATAAISPVSLGFGAGPPDVNASRTLTVSNTGRTVETFTLSAVQTGTGPVPQLQPGTVRLEPGASAGIAVKFTGTALGAGTYEGFIVVQGSNTSTPTRVPYWYGVTSGVPKYITQLFVADTARANSNVSLAVLFKVTDANGLPITDPFPEATVVSGGGSNATVRSRDALVPNAYSLGLRLGPRPGANRVTIRVGDLTQDFTVVGH